MRQCCQVGRCSCRSVASSAAPSIDPACPCLLFDVQLREVRTYSLQTIHNSRGILARRKDDVNRRAYVASRRKLRPTKVILRIESRVNVQEIVGKGGVLFGRLSR